MVNSLLKAFSLLRFFLFFLPQQLSLSTWLSSPTARLPALTLFTTRQQDMPSTAANSTANTAISALLTVLAWVTELLSWLSYSVSCTVVLTAGVGAGAGVSTGARGRARGMVQSMLGVFSMDWQQKRVSSLSGPLAIMNYALADTPRPSPSLSAPAANVNVGSISCSLKTSQVLVLAQTDTQPYSDCLGLSTSLSPSQESLSTWPPTTQPLVMPGSILDWYTKLPVPGSNLNTLMPQTRTLELSTWRVYSIANVLPSWLMSTDSMASACVTSNISKLAPICVMVLAEGEQLQWYTNRRSTITRLVGEPAVQSRNTWLMSLGVAIAGLSTYRQRVLEQAMYLTTFCRVAADCVQRVYSTTTVLKSALTSMSRSWQARTVSICWLNSTTQSVPFHPKMKIPLLPVISTSLDMSALKANFLMPASMGTGLKMRQQGVYWPELQRSTCTCAPTEYASTLQEWCTWAWVIGKVGSGVVRVALKTGQVVRQGLHCRAARSRQSLGVAQESRARYKQPIWLKALGLVMAAMLTPVMETKICSNYSAMVLKANACSPMNRLSVRAQGKLVAPVVSTPFVYTCSMQPMSIPLPTTISSISTLMIEQYTVAELSPASTSRSIVNQTPTARQRLLCLTCGVPAPENAQSMPRMNRKHSCLLLGSQRPAGLGTLSRVVMGVSGAVVPSSTLRLNMVGLQGRAQRVRSQTRQLSYSIHRSVLTPMSHQTYRSVLPMLCTEQWNPVPPMLRTSIPAMAIYIRAWGYCCVGQAGTADGEGAGVGEGEERDGGARGGGGDGLEPGQQQLRGAHRGETAAAQGQEQQHQHCRQQGGDRARHLGQGRLIIREKF